MNRSLHTVPELVAYALFDLDPRVKQAQLPLYDFMVSLALYESDESMTETELVESVAELLPTGASVAHDQIHVAVDAHVELGLIDRDGAGELRLSALRYGQLDEARIRLVAHRTAFHDHMLGTVTERAALSGDEARVLYEALEDRLQELLRAQSSTLAAAWAGGGGFDAALQELNAREHLKEVANRVAPGGAQPNAVRRTALALGLEIGLSTLPTDAAAYLGALYQRTVAFALLEQDPHIRRVKSQLASQRLAYLDTNVVMAAMFDADHEHDLACQVLELTRTLGADLRVTRFTIDELTRRLEDANRWMARYRGDASLRAVVDDVVVRSYHRATRTSPALRWGAFIGGFDPPDAWLAEHGITVERDRCQETEQDRRVEQARSAVKRHRNHVASDRVLQTDALNLVHVERARRNLVSDEMGNRAWFVTFDRGLSRADRYLVEHNIFGYGVTRLSQGWVDLLSPCLPPDNEHLSEYVTHLVQSQFSLLAEDPMFVNKDFLLTITRSRFDVASILDTTPERARQILIRLQQEEELQALLGEPEPDSDDWNARLAEVVNRALAELEQSPEQMAALASQQQARVAAERRADEERKGRLETTRELAEAQAVAGRLAVERDELSGELQRERSLPWWRRMFRRSNNR
jgi:hypothetical protein